jgi:hypothetical protein
MTNVRQGVVCAGQAGANSDNPKLRIEVTPEMIEAGMCVARDVADMEWEHLPACRAAEIIADIYRAMRLATGDRT